MGVESCFVVVVVAWVVGSRNCVFVVAFGGERVLWVAIRERLARGVVDAARWRVVVYTGDAVGPAEIRAHAASRFGVDVPAEVEFVYLACRGAIEARRRRWGGVAVRVVPRARRAEVGRRRKTSRVVVGVCVSLVALRRRADADEGAAAQVEVAAGDVVDELVREAGQKERERRAEACASALALIRALPCYRDIDFVSVNMLSADVRSRLRSRLLARQRWYMNGLRLRVQRIALYWYALPYRPSGPGHSRDVVAWESMMAE